MITSDCPRCDAPSASVEAREGSSLKCAQCGLVFDPMRARPKTKSLAASKTELVAPDGFEATLTRAGIEGSYRDGVRGEAELAIVRRWAPRVDPRAYLLIAAVLVSVVLPAIGFEIGLGTAVIALFALVCAGFLYAAIAGRMNTTTITVKAGKLEIHHAPVPWVGNLSLDASAINQLYCQQQRTISMSQPESYGVFAIVRDREKPLLLVDNLDLASHALFLESAIERALGIEDRPVPGEVQMKKLP